MKLLFSIKDIIDIIFNYVKHFDRSNHVRLFGSGILISIISATAVLSLIYGIEQIVPSVFIENPYAPAGFFKFYVFISDNLNLIIGTTLLNFALVSTHFLSFTNQQENISLVDSIRGLSSKKWGLYLSFLIILFIISLYPSPYLEDGGSFYSLLNLSVSGISTLGFWLYELIELFMSVLAVVFAILLVQKERFVVKELVKNRIGILAIILIIFGLNELFLALSVAIDTYLGNLFVLLDEKNIFGILLSILKLFLLVYLIPAQITALTYGDAPNLELVKSRTKDNENVLDDSI